MKSTDIRLQNYGPESQPHRAVISYVYELPVGTQGKQFLSSTNRVLGGRWMIGGWQVNGITTMRAVSTWRHSSVQTTVQAVGPATSPMDRASG